METKTCTKCKQEKPLSEYYKNGRVAKSNGEYKYKARCKSCVSQAVRGKHKKKEFCGKIPQVCEGCGETFIHKRGERKRYCSFKCSQAKPITLTCENCGNQYEREPSIVKAYNRNFCSTNCYRQVQRQECLEAEAEREKEREQRRLEYQWRRILHQKRKRLWSVVLDKALKRNRARTKYRQEYHADPWKKKFTVWRGWTRSRPRPMGKARNRYHGDKAILRTKEIPNSPWEGWIGDSMKRLRHRRYWYSLDPWRRKITNKLSNLRKRRRSKHERKQRREEISQCG